MTLPPAGDPYEPHRGQPPAPSTYSPIPGGLYSPPPVTATVPVTAGWPSPYGPAQPAQYPVLPAKNAYPDHPVEYHAMLRTQRGQWWKGLLAIGSFVASYLVISLVLQGGAVAIDIATGRLDTEEVVAGRLALTPALLVSVNVTNALCIPLAILLQWAFYGQSGATLHSVIGRFRWRYAARCAVIVVPVWALFMGSTAFFLPEGSALTKESIALLVIVLLTTPLQAAGEEYGARGLLNRAAASWSARPGVSLWLGTIVSSALFMAGHGAGDPWLLVFYFGFGVGLSLLTWRTGGLEGAIVIHTVHNMMTFGLAILSGQDMADVLDRSAGRGNPSVLFALALVAAVVAVLAWRARRTGVVRVFDPSRAYGISAPRSRF